MLTVEVRVHCALRALSPSAQVVLVLVRSVLAAEGVSLTYGNPSQHLFLRLPRATLPLPVAERGAIGRPRRKRRRDPTRRFCPVLKG